MPLHLSISHSVHGGRGVSQHVMDRGCTPPRQTPPWADTPIPRHSHPLRWPLRRAVRILLECILVYIYFQTVNINNRVFYS